MGEIGKGDSKKTETESETLIGVTELHVASK